MNETTRELPETITIAGIELHRVPGLDDAASTSWAARGQQRTGCSSAYSHACRYSGEPGAFMAGKWAAWLAIGTSCTIENTKLCDSPEQLDQHMRQLVLQAADELTAAAVALFQARTAPIGPATTSALDALGAFARAMEPKK